MIVFVEDRALVVESYKSKFEKAGETLLRLNARDLSEWLRTGSKADLASIEAVLIGECDEQAQFVSKLRAKLNAPIVAMLDNRCLEQLTQLYKFGVDDVVAKPVHFEELMFRIAAIKKRIVTHVSTETETAITVFFDGRDPEYRGASLDLPRRERRILEYLASINGRRATKAQIFGAIYGVFDDLIEESVIESHISKLRKKLRSKIGCDPIDSKRYLGYRFNPEMVQVENKMQNALVA
ncbi:MAG: winged helix-turn-helix domain-containing protein [Nitratireductor sp.]